MTRAMYDVIVALMGEVAGVDYLSDDFDMTEGQCDTVCERCPYRANCYGKGICYGCPNWEYAMGEDL